MLSSWSISSAFLPISFRNVRNSNKLCKVNGNIFPSFGIPSIQNPSGMVWCGDVAQTKIENVQLLLFDIGNFEWFLRRFSLFANGLVNGGWLVGRSLDMPDCVFMFLLPPQRPSYMFNGVLCIHLYLLLLLLSASQTEQTHPNICTVFRSSLPFCCFSFPLHFILGQYFQFARLQTDSFYFRIYGY